MPDHPRQTSLPGFEPAEENPLPGEQKQNGCQAQPDLPSDLQSSSFIPHPSSFSLQSPASLLGKTVWVIDGHSLIHQVFHALPEMSSPRGEPVGAVFGFTRDLIFLLEEKQPDYLFCAFDLPGKTFRHEMYKEYKIQRPEMDVDLRPQISAIRRVLQVFGIPALGCESFEADDILATLARITDELGGECFLVTSDKDCRQLISDRVKLYNIRKNMFFDREALREDWGIAPEQVVDFQALVGDPGDNIPGVPLIGPKYAREYLEQYGTLEAVLDHAADIPGAKRKDNLLKFHDQALLSRELARLNAHVPVTIPWDMPAGRIDRPAALALFREFGFRSLGQKIDVLCESLVLEGPHPSPLPEGEGTMIIEPTYHLIDTPEAFETFLSELKKQKSISLDTETTNVLPRWAWLVGLSFCWNENEAWYLPVRSPPGEGHLDLQSTLNALRPILEDPTVEKVGQNLKYDMIVLRAVGIRLAGTAFDTMVASYLLDAGQRNHNLDDIALDYLGHETIKITDLIGSGKNQKHMDEVPVHKWPIMPAKTPCCPCVCARSWLINLPRTNLTICLPRSNCR